MALASRNHGPDAESLSKSDVFITLQMYKKAKHLQHKKKNIFVITIQSSTIYKFDNLDRPIQAQIFYNKSRFTKKITNFTNKTLTLQ